MAPRGFSELAGALLCRRWETRAAKPHASPQLQPRGSRLPAGQQPRPPLAGQQRQQTGIYSFTTCRSLTPLGPTAAPAGRLGSHNPRIGSAIGTAALRRAADEHAGNVRPIIEEMQRRGIDSPSAISAALNARGVRTARGGQWYATTVSNLLRRPIPVEAR
jgi:hypothetical protein